MSLEHDPARNEPGIVTGLDGMPRGPPDASDYWHGLIPEKVAAAFLGLTIRWMQGMRQRGDGPPYIRISSRCVRYTRIRLREYAEARVRKSTSDPDPEAS